MTDRLTVDSSGTGAQPGAARGGAASPETRRARDELERIKSAVRQRHGRALTDAQAEVVLRRREARLGAAQARAEKRQALEAAAGGATVTPRASDARLEAATLAGTPAARRADGLTAEQRRGVAGDSKAAPALPPAEAPPATPGQARVALGKMLAHVAVGGERLAVAAYAATVRPKSDRNAAAREAPPTGEPPGSAASLTMAVRGAGSGQAGGTSAGALGGVVSDTSFDAMHFDWDAFFARFLVRSTEDAQLWRKMLKEMRRLAGESRVALQDAALEVLMMRQSFERADATRGMVRATLGLLGARAKHATDETLSKLFGPRGKPSTPADSLATQRAFEQAAAGSSGSVGVLATLRDQPGSELAKAWSALTPLQQLSVLMREQAGAASDVPGLGSAIAERWNAVARTLREGLPNPRDAARARVHAYLTDVRTALANEQDPAGPVALALSGQIYAVEEALLLTFPPAGQASGGGAPTDAAGPAATGGAPEVGAPWTPAPLRVPPKGGLAAALALHERAFAADAALSRASQRSRADDVGQRLDEALGAGGDALARDLGPLVDGAVQGAMALARENRGELDAKIRESMGQAQGMLSQLAQLLGASRAR